jgi:hypothetical protein
MKITSLFTPLQNGDCRGMYIQNIPWKMTAEPIPGTEEQFIPRGIKLWPPGCAPKAVAGLLCPSRDMAGIRVLSDERSLVYLVNVKDYISAVILISFDPRI